VNDAIDTVERLLCERYNVSSLDGLGSLPVAIESARQGDLTPLNEALDSRELYRWAKPIRDALGSVSAPAPEEQPAEPDVPVEQVADDQPEAEEETEATGDEPEPEEQHKPRGRRRAGQPDEPTS